MSTNDELDQLALEYTCGFCGMGPGEWCRTKSDIKTQFLHSSRQNPIFSAYGLGYCDAEDHYRVRP